MSTVSHAGWSFSCLACTLKFPKFSALEINLVNYRSNVRRSKQKLIYECVITQLVSLSITLHLYTYSSVVVYPCLQSAQEVTLFSSKCYRQLVQGLYIPPHKMLTLWVRFYNLMHQENNNFSLHKFFWMLGSLWKGNHFSPCCYFNRSLFLFALLQVSTNISEDLALNSKWKTKHTILLNWYVTKILTVSYVFDQPDSGIYDN